MPRLLASCIVPLFAAACAPAEHAVPDTPVTRPSAVEVADARARAILADSVAADSVALASLPARQREDFDVLHLLSQEALADSARSFCQPLSDSTENDVRKRLRARDARGLAVVLFVRAHRATGAVQRVELVRRQAWGGQRGYIWNEADRTLRALEWENIRSQPDEYEIPAGNSGSPRAPRTRQTAPSRLASRRSASSEGSRRASRPARARSASGCPSAHRRAVS